MSVILKVYPGSYIPVQINTLFGLEHSGPKIIKSYCDLKNALIVGYIHCVLAGVLAVAHPLVLTSCVCKALQDFLSVYRVSSFHSISLAST